jgi:hypothetical protein
MGIVDNALMGASGQSGYNLTRSLRFRSSASGYLSRTPAASNRKTWTLSLWMKRSTAGTDVYLYEGYSSDANRDLFRFANDTLIYGNASATMLQTTQVFRDPSAWYHFVLVSDTTQATAANRVKLYVNGSQITAFTTSSYPAQNYEGFINSNVLQTFMRSSYAGGYGYQDGYLTEINFIDGQALTPSSFGSTNLLTGVWQPARYTGTYGTNGFYLPFTDNSALTTSSNVGLGKDFSGNGNFFATNNISITAGVTYDSMTDVPTLTSATAANFAVLNPISNNITYSITNGNLSISNGGVAKGTKPASFFLTSGKWYWEVVGNGYAGAVCGVNGTAFTGSVSSSGSNAIGYWEGGIVYWDGGNSGTGASYTTSDIIGIALDMSAGTVAFYKNNTLQYTATFGSGTVPNLSSGCFPCYNDGAGAASKSADFNFGQRPFAYTPPTGFVALNTYNLPNSTIVNGSKEMGILLYTGDGTTSKDVTGLSFQPDLTYVKNRSAASDPTFSDTLRGITKVLYTDATSAESTAPSFGYINSILSTGFNVNSGGGTEANFNKNGQNYVGWTWKAGQGTNTSNTSGTITSTVSVNASAGLSMVTYTGTGANATVGHGLGVAPSLIIAKSRGAATNWGVWHTSLTASSYFLLLNTTAAQATAANSLQALPTSTLVSLGASSIFNDASTMVMYCWTPIAGYSAFGSYTGNGSTDGPFVYLGFRPRWVMVKATSAVENWAITDSARSSFNAANALLRADESSAETTGAMTMDFNSNGFKMRTTDSKSNGSGVTYIYIAYAENPFKNALAR